MPLDTQVLCQYRLKRAEEDLLTAENNHQSGFYKAAINRSYYAIFHSIRAVNILDGFDAIIASKDDSKIQLENAKKFLQTVKIYLQEKKTGSTVE